MITNLMSYNLDFKNPSPHFLTNTIENLPDITVDNHVEEKNKATKDWKDVSC